MKRVGIVLAVVTLVIFGIVISFDQRSLINRTNYARTSRNIPPLIDTNRLNIIATNHSTRMRNRSRLYHTAYRYQPCAYWGENVGVGASVGEVFNAFMNSPDHRANILNPSFHHLGVGVIKGGGRVWVTQEFCA